MFETGTGDAQKCDGEVWGEGVAEKFIGFDTK